MVIEFKATSLIFSAQQQRRHAQEEAFGLLNQTQLSQHASERGGDPGGMFEDQYILIRAKGAKNHSLQIKSYISHPPDTMIQIPRPLAACNAFPRITCLVANWALAEVTEI